MAAKPPTPNCITLGADDPRIIVLDLILDDDPDRGGLQAAFVETGECEATERANAALYPGRQYTGRAVPSDGPQPSPVAPPPEDYVELLALELGENLLECAGLIDHDGIPLQPLDELEVFALSVKLSRKAIVKEYGC